MRIEFNNCYLVYSCSPLQISVIARVLESIAKKEISKSWLGKSLQHPLQEEGGGGAGEDGPECSHDLDTTRRG